MVGSDRILEVREVHGFSSVFSSTTESVSAANAIKTPQFWLLWVVLFCNVTAGIGILEQAAPMIQDFFRNGESSLVAATAAAGFVGVLSLFNMGGRFVWSTTSDYIGRKPMYMIYLGVGTARLGEEEEPVKEPVPATPARSAKPARP